MTHSCQSVSSAAATPWKTRVIGIGSGSPSFRATWVAMASTADESRPPEKATPHGGRSERLTHDGLESLPCRRPPRRREQRRPTLPNRNPSAISVGVIT